MPTFNSVTLVGHLTRDPELRYTPQGAAVSDFSVAVHRKFTKKDGEKVDEVSFIDVTAWNRQAEIVAEFLKKGRAVLVSGRLQQDRWEDPATGQKRSKLRVVSENLQFLDGGPGAAGRKDEGAPHEEPAPSNESASEAPPPEGDVPFEAVPARPAPGPKARAHAKRA